MNIRKIKYGAKPDVPSSENPTRAAFQDEDEAKRQQPPKKGLKIDNANSSIQPTQEIEENFQEKINRIISDEEEQKKVAFELTSKFFSILKDKTLDEAKTTIVRDKEKTTIRNLIDFNRVVNADPNQEDDLGTMSLLATCLRCFFIQRDRINNIEYENVKLQKEVAALSKKTAELSAQLEKLSK